MTVQKERTPSVQARIPRIRPKRHDRHRAMSLTLRGWVAILGVVGICVGVNAQSVLLDFEDLTPGVYRHPLHPQPSPSMFTTGGITVYLRDYYFESCTPNPRQKVCASDCIASNECPWTEGVAMVQQLQDIEVQLVSVNLGFGILSARSIEVHYHAWLGGGVNIEINDEFLAAHMNQHDMVSSSVEKLDNQVVGGYLITVDPVAGTLTLTPHTQSVIRSFSFGGQELRIDDIAFHNVVIPEPDPTEDPREPNDNPQLATDLGAAGEIGIHDLTIHAADDQDFFRVTAADSGTLTVAASFSHAAGDLDLCVYDSNLQPLGYSLTEDDNETVSIEVVGGQTYFIHVFGFQGATNPRYDLSVLGPAIPPLPDGFEPNDTREFAWRLGTAGSIREDNLSIHSPGNEDYFRVTAATSGTMNVEILFSHAAGDLDLGVYHANGQGDVRSTSVDDNENIAFPVTGGQDYYVHVYGFNGAVNPDYDLVVHLPGAVFRRGDANGDGKTDLSDPVSLLIFLFLGGPAPTCLDAADPNDSGSVDLTDSVYLLDFLFRGGPPPRPPFPHCGPDPTPDALFCAAFEPCT